MIDLILKLNNLVSQENLDDIDKVDSRLASVKKSGADRHLMI